MNKQFLKEFIICLQNEPALWQNKSEANKSKFMRNKSWKVLQKKYQELDAEATLDVVKKKVNSLRATYRRELQKIKRSEESGAAADDVYVPTIWYFQDLNFLRDHESLVDAPNTSYVDEELEVPTPKHKKRKREVSHDFLKKSVPHLEIAKNKRPRDDADVFAEGWAVMFRQLSREQKIFAKRGIDELLTQGQLGMLSYWSVSCIANTQSDVQELKCCSK